MGHCIFIYLLYRPLLSIFFHCYRFIEADYQYGHAPWASVVKECRWARSLLPMLFAKLDMPWGEAVHASDSCFTGYCVVKAYPSISVVRSNGRWDERWRYKRENWQTHAPRSIMREDLDPFQDVETVRGAAPEEEFLHVDRNFPDVSNVLLHKDSWTHGWSSPWLHN